MPLCYNAALLKALMDKTAQKQLLIKKKGLAEDDCDDEAEASGETGVAEALAAVEEEALSPATKAIAALKAAKRKASNVTAAPKASKKKKAAKTSKKKKGSKKDKDKKKKSKRDRVESEEEWSDSGSEGEGEGSDDYEGSSSSDEDHVGNDAPPKQRKNKRNTM